MRLVQWREGAELPQLGDDVGIDEYWSSKSGASMDYAMADRSHLLPAQESDGSFEDSRGCGGVIKFFGLPALLDQLLAFAILDDQLRRNAELLYLAPEEDGKFATIFENRELDAGGAGVDDC
jgi:hypothetical protein